MLIGGTELAIVGTLMVRPMYGMELCDQIAKLTGGAASVSINGFYTLMHRIETKGLVEGYWGSEETPAARRRYYRVTKDGTKAFNDVHLFVSRVASVRKKR